MLGARKKAPEQGLGCLGGDEGIRTLETGFARLLP